MYIISKYSTRYLKTPSLQRLLISNNTSIRNHNLTCCFGSLKDDSSKNDYNEQNRIMNNQKISKEMQDALNDKSIPDDVREYLKNSDELKNSKKVIDNKDNEEDELEDDNSFINEKRKYFYIFTLISAGLFGGYLTMQLDPTRIEENSKKPKKINKVKVNIGGPWLLWDTEGQEFTHRNLQGYNYLIYFGFCNCPDVCPDSLQKLANAVDLIKKMPEAQYIKLKTVFVSLDPDRDTPKKIKKFLELFDSNIIGVTGRSNDDPNLKDIMKKFRIYSSKLDVNTKEPLLKNDKPSQGSNAYTLDHTTITYLMDTNNNYLIHLAPDMDENDMGYTIVDTILNPQRSQLIKIINLRSKNAI